MPDHDLPHTCNQVHGSVPPVRPGHPLGREWQWLQERSGEGQAGPGAPEGREEGPWEAARGGTMNETRLHCPISLHSKTQIQRQNY